ncbi:putative secreted protein (Por secretion system target) [Flavobacteriaceae bacterium MAR_2010_105]|nr:putative secreted protein (Por secretion system target) [Flavobacteriaceae bacterium MAR_2010_105]
MLMYKITRIKLANSLWRCWLNVDKKTNILAVFVMFIMFFFTATNLQAQVVPCIDGQSLEWGSPQLQSEATFELRHDVFTGNMDDIYTGSKDFKLFGPNNNDSAYNEWTLSPMQAKSDIMNAAAVLFTGVSSPPGCTSTFGAYDPTHTYLFFAGDRESNLGSGYIGFWFLLNGTTATTDNGQNIFDPAHSIGDLLILANFESGGREAVVTVLKWVGPGNGTHGNNLSLVLQGTDAQVGQNNDTQTPVPANFIVPEGQTVYDYNEFYEGVIDLTEVFNLQDPNNSSLLCSATWLLETRASKEITADLKDFVGGNFNITPTIQVTDDTICEGETGSIKVNIFKDVDQENPIVDPIAKGFTIEWTGPNGFVASGTDTISPTVEGTYTATVGSGDFCDETAQDTGELTIIDASSVSCPVDSNQAACQTQGAINTAFTTFRNSFTFTAGDDEDYVVKYYINDAEVTKAVFDAASAPNNCGGSIKLGISIDDECLDVPDTCSATFTVAADTEKPVITIDSSNDPAGACNPTIVPPTFSVSDNCDAGGSVAPQTTGPSNVGCAYTQTWTANYTDACGNVADQKSVTYTWTVDTEKPVITIDSSDDPAGACNPTIVPPTFSVSDNCDAGGSVAPQTTGPSNVGCAYTQTWTANYTDACGNVADQKSVTYTWTVDTEKPVITVDSSDDPAGACNPTIVPPTFSVSDNCDPGGSVAPQTNGPSNVGCAYTQTWTANYTDACGNVADQKSVTYTWTVDTEKPVITIDSSDDPAGACNPTIVPPTFSVSDNCDPGGSVAPQTNGPSNVGCAYTQTWTANYTDACGNVADQKSVTYTWTVDNEKPVITIDSSNDPAGACNPTIVPPTFSVSDNCDAGGSVAPQTTGPSNVGCAYTQTWTANYTDACGNVADQKSVTYTWTVDTEKPVITIDSSDDPAGACNPTIVPPTFSVSDNCDAGGSVAPQTTGPSNVGCAYTQTWTANYTDACGNVADQKSVTYTWTVDTEKPVITIDSSDDPAGACNPTIVPPTFSVSDNCDPGGSVAPQTNGPSNVGCAYTQTWTANYTDACGNVADQKSVTYTWTVDTEKPVITIDSSDDPAGACNPTIVPPTFSVSDNCDPGGSVAPQTNGPSNVGCAYTQTWTANYTDACGNVADQKSVTYTWTVDNEKPVITIDSSNDPAGACNPTIVPPTFSVSDNCDAGGSVAPQTTGPTNVGCAYTQTWTANYTDSCGNVADQKSVTYTWTVDTVMPEIADVPDYMLNGCEPAWPPFLTTSWTDNCDAGGNINSNAGVPDGTSQDGCIEYRLYTFTITDSCGNSDTETTRVGRNITPPSCTASVVNDLQCFGVPINLHVEGTGCRPPLTYLWEGNGFDATTVLDDVTSPDPIMNAGVGSYTFTVTVTDQGGCSSTCEVTATVYDCTPDCGTAFGVFIDEIGSVDSNASRCFRNDGFSRWGWTNFISGFGTYTLELYQGAGKCDLDKGTFVGIVTVNYTQIGLTDEGYVNVEYDMEPGYGIDEAHLYIGCELYPEHNGRETVAPGQYTFVEDGLGHIDKWSTETDAITATGGFYIIAHAVACGEDIPEGSYIPESPYEEGNFNGGVDPQCKVEVSDFGRVTDFTAYPNPFENEVNVKYVFEYETDVKIEVFDIKGTLIRSALDNNYVQGSVGRTTIDLSKADNQMYFVRLTTNEGTVVKKIVSSSSLDRQR